MECRGILKHANLLRKIVDALSDIILMICSSEVDDEKTVRTLVLIESDGTRRVYKEKRPP